LARWESFSVLVGSGTFRQFITIRRFVMKWGGYNPQAAERLNRVFGKVLGKKGIYYLLMIVSLGLVLSAGMKWHV